MTNTPGVLPVSLTGARAAWGDYNNDGDVDLNHGGILLKNNGNGTFSNPGVDFDGTGVWGDYDKDGYLDWFNYSDKRIYHNDGGSGFTEVAKPSLPSTISAGGAWGDFNGDTYLDLYVGGYENSSSSVYYPDSRNLGF